MITVLKKEPPGEAAAVIAAIRKDKGERVVYSGTSIPPVERLATGLFEFDLATGGGFPRGRVSQIYGPESSGKSNLLYLAIAAAQKLPPPCNKAVLISMEGTEDPEWMAKFGIDMENLIIVRPSYGEEAIDLTLALLQADDVAFLGVDSLAMLTSQKEVEQSVEKFDVGTSALLIKRMCNKIAVAFGKEQERNHFPTVVLVNQTRFKIGVIWGDPETFPGGNAVRFLLSLNVRLYGKNKTVKEVHPDLPVFKETKAVVKKAKVPVCQSVFEYDMVVHPHDGLGVGESDAFKVVSDHLKAAEVVAPTKGGWSYRGETFQTLAVLKERYRTDLPFRLQMQGEVIASLRGKQFFVEDEAEKGPNPKEAA